MRGNGSWRPALVAAVSTIAAVALAVEPRLRRGPTPVEVVADLDRKALVVGGVPLPHAAVAAAAAALVAGALATSVVLAARPLRRRAGAFGLPASAVWAAAAAAAVLAAPWWSLGWKGAAVVAVAASLAAAAASPLCADRGMLSLLVVSLVVGGTLAVARREALGERRVAAQLAADRAAVTTQGKARLVVAVPADRSLAMRQALAKSVWPPRADAPIEIATAPVGSGAEQSLRAAGWSGVELGGTRPKPLEPLPAPATDAVLPNEVDVRWLEPVGPVAVLRPSRGRFELRVVTAAGMVAEAQDDPTRGLRLHDRSAELHAMLRPLPADEPMLVQVVSEMFPAGSAWFRVTR